MKKVLKQIYLFIYNSWYSFLGKYFPKKLASIRYQKVVGKPLDWDNPIDLNEKINWLKFNSDTSLWPLLADKYRVREYIESKGLGHTLNKLYGVWENPDEIDFDKLPNSFVLKSNNGYATVLIVRDKEKLNYEETRKTMHKWLSQVYGYETAEPHYLKIKPVIIAEALLDDNSESFSLIDYKVHCFNGEPYSIKLCYDRKIHQAPKFEIYDLQWQPHFEYVTPQFRGDKIFPKPKILDEMLQCSKILAEGFPNMRVDWYVVNNKLFFGEITMTPAAGYISFYTNEYLVELGKHINLEIND